jgi:hypothetical protein
MRNSLKAVTSFLALAVTFTLFSTSALAFPGAQGQQSPQAAPANAPAKTAAKGTVVETMNSGGYTYVLLDNGGQKSWAAIPNSEVKVGQEVELAPGMVMNGFSSKTLGRTFDAILFSQGLVSVK